MAAFDGYKSKTFHYKEDDDVPSDVSGDVSREAAMNRVTAYGIEVGAWQPVGQTPAAASGGGDGAGPSDPTEEDRVGAGTDRAARAEAARDRVTRDRARREAKKEAKKPKTGG